MNSNTSKQFCGSGGNEGPGQTSGETETGIDCQPVNDGLPALDLHKLIVIALFTLKERGESKGGASAEAVYKCIESFGYKLSWTSFCKKFEELKKNNTLDQIENTVDEPVEDDDDDEDEVILVDQIPEEAEDEGNGGSCDGGGGGDGGSYVGGGSGDGGSRYVGGGGDGGSGDDGEAIKEAAVKEGGGYGG